jgi:hypothetical protein
MTEFLWVVSAFNGYIINYFEILYLLLYMHDILLLIHYSYYT